MDDTKYLLEVMKRRWVTMGTQMGGLRIDSSTLFTPSLILLETGYFSSKGIKLSLAGVELSL